VPADADVAQAAALIGDPTRAAFLLALSEVDAVPATELAARARVPASTASGHLAKLVEGGLLVVEPRGRHRYYRLAAPAVAEALEALAVIAPARPARSLKEAVVGDAVRVARTCYDHLAGRLGVALTDALVRDGVLDLEDDSYRVGDAARLAELGIDVDELSRSRRVLARPCLDWSERRHHVAGALGAALAQLAFTNDWIERLPGSRAVRVTEDGRKALKRELNVALD
jgi:DNA-binding transcriptional ArsR family regulator